MQESYIFIFYLAIIIVAAVVTYRMSDASIRMDRSMAAAIIGAIISIVLWNTVGKYNV